MGLRARLLVGGRAGGRRYILGPRSGPKNRLGEGGLLFRLRSALPEATPSGRSSPVCSRRRQCPYPPCGVLPNDGSRGERRRRWCRLPCGFPGRRVIVGSKSTGGSHGEPESSAQRDPEVCTCSQQIVRWKPRPNQRLLSTRIVRKTNNGRFYCMVLFRNGEQLDPAGSRCKD